MAVRRRIVRFAVAAVLAMTAFTVVPPFRPDGAFAIQPLFDRNVRIDDSPGPVRSAQIEVSGGVLHAAWLDFRSGDADVYYSRSTDLGAS